MANLLGWIAGLSVFVSWICTALPRFLILFFPGDFLFAQ